MHIVVAPDSFKGSLSAQQAASIMKKAILSVNQKIKVTTKPMADGGEGTVDALLLASNGRRIPLTCTGPLGEKTKTYYAIQPDNTAIIEVANIAGLVQVPEEKRNPDLTTTYGIGEAIIDALDKGCTSFIIGLGGSSTNDGGLGLLQALGMEAWDEAGNKVGPFGKDLLTVNRVSFKKMDNRLSEATFRVACDVDNPLCGERGASAIFGPQKGATQEQIHNYDKALLRYASLIANKKEKDVQQEAGAGAAGGLGFAMLTLGATLVSGAKLIADASDLENTIKQADLVITGEGQSDQQTLYGKAPGFVADVAAANHVPAILISGSLAGNLDELRTKFAGCFSIINRPLALQACMEQAESLLIEQTKQIISVIDTIEKNDAH